MKQILSILFVCLLSTSSFAQEVCVAPTGLSSELRPNGRAARLSWNSNPTANNYRVQVFNIEGTRIFNGVFNDTIMVVRGLTRGETYGWRVRSQCGGGNNSAYVNSSFTTTVSCTDPSNLTSQVRPNGRAARLSWSPSSTRARYRVRVFDSNNDRIFNGVFNDTIMVVRGLIPGESYTWGVQGRCGGGQNTDVVTSSFTTGSVTSSCETPVKLTSNVRRNGRSAMLSWTRSLDHIDDTILVTNLRYSVQVFNSSQERIFNGLFNDTMMVVRGLVPGGSYTWGVRAICGGGQTSGIASSSFSVPLASNSLSSSIGGALVAFPNPTNQSSVTLRWDLENISSAGVLSQASPSPEVKRVSIQLLDYTGKQLYRMSPDSGQQEVALDISSLATGMYFIQLTADNGYKTVTKFIKE